MNHYLVTRFNLTVEQWKEDKNKNKVLTDKWLSERFKLFNEFCLPSIKNQTNQDFVWLVLFDQKTPDKYIEVINQIKNDYSNFHPIFIDGNRELSQALKNFVFNFSDNISEYIITTRVDNDDSIHKEFINEIKILAKPIHNLIIDVRFGYQMSFSKNHLIFRNYKQNYNPFISLVQNKNQFISIFDKEHTEWINMEFLVKNESKRLWIQIIHGRNKLNSINFHNRMVLVENLQDFGLQNISKQHSKVFTKVYNFLLSIAEFMQKCFKK